MKERPILFSGAMVRAILEGRKTQTRRAVKPQPPAGHSFVGFTMSSTHQDDEGKATWAAGDTSAILMDARRVRCPYGEPGDRLWVREAWQQFFDDEMPASRPRGPIGTMGCPATPDRKSRVFYRADGVSHPSDQFGAPTWCPSIHMPRWASRITLGITGVRCERLQDISAADAIAEGLKAISKDGTLVKYGIPDNDGLPGNDDHGWHWQEWERDPRNAYCKLWEQINGPGTWYTNPWVWVIEFRRVEAK